jgi:error-prone DNA polymerase
VNLVILPRVYERFRAVVRSEPLLLVRGRYEHSDRNRNVLVDELVSLAPLARSLTDGADVHAALPRAHHFGHR